MALLTTRAGTPLGPVRDEHGDELTAAITGVAAVARAEGADSDPAATRDFTWSLPDVPVTRAIVEELRARLG